MITLPNGCWCSGQPGDPKKGTTDQLSVFPKNWHTTRASLKADWYISYYFHDPTFKDHPKYFKGKRVDVKSGINRHKTLAARQEAIQVIMDNELRILKEEGYNPITGQSLAPIEEEIIIDPNTPLVKALELAKDRLENVGSTIADIESILRYVKPAAQQLRFDQMPVCLVEKKHVRLILDQCGRNKGEKWTANNFNHYRRYLSALFNALEQIDAVRFNPVHKIGKKDKIERIRQVFTEEERSFLNVQLALDHPRLWLYMHAFFHSGARMTEMNRLRVPDVNLAAQEIKFMVLKPKPHEVMRPIKDVAVRYWEMILDGAGPDDYIFCRGLRPGKKPMGARSVTQLWRDFVKLKYGIMADFYTLKHCNSEETAALLDMVAAALQNGHTSTRMVEKHYAPKQKEKMERQLKEQLKRLNNVLA